MVRQEKALTRRFVKEIKMAADKGLLTDTMPIPSREIPGERVRVFSFSHFGGAEVSIGRTFEVVFDLTF